MIRKNHCVWNIIITGIMSSLVFLGTYLMRIEVVIWGCHIMIHFGNMFCLMAAILFGRQCGALSGALGMSLFDLVSGRFIYYIPFMFVLKFVMGFVCGTIKNKFQHCMDNQKLNMLSVAVALLINISVSPIISLMVKVWVYNFNFYVAEVQAIGSMINVIINSILSGCLTVILLRFIEPIIVNNRK